MNTLTTPLETTQTELVQGLLKLAIDGRDGFSHASGLVTDTELTSFFTGMSTQRATMVSDLEKLLDGQDVDYSTDGSLLAAAHRGWITLKDAVTDEDPEAVVNAALNAERYALDQYESAFAYDFPQDVKDMLTKHVEMIRASRNQLERTAAL